MASLPFDVLFDTPDLMLPQESDADAAVEIAATSNVISTTLTMVEFRNGELIFSDEVPASMYTEWRDFKYSQDIHHRWLRVELKVDSKSKRISSGYSLVATRWPRGNAWTCNTEFKPAWKGLRGKNPQPGLDGKTLPELLHWLEDAPCDYWEQSGLLTAGISQPEREVLEASRDAKKKSFTLMGVCADFDKCVAFLENSEKVRMLRSKTKQGTIRFGHADRAKSDSGKPPKLYENLIDTVLNYLDISIKQALAGDMTPASWAGRPVVDLVNIIYREHLNNANRRENRRMGGGSRVVLVPYDDAASHHQDHEGEVDDEIEDSAD